MQHMVLMIHLTGRNAAASLTSLVTFWLVHKQMLYEVMLRASCILALSQATRHGFSIGRF